MQQPTQEQFVADCLSKYRWEPIPSDQQWEVAHFPLPSCSGEHDTVQLWSADHTVQGLLQSVEFDHQCFHGYRNKHDTDLLTAYWPAYLPLFQQLKVKFSSRRGKKSGKKIVELKLGIYGRSAEQITADNKRGGEVGGKKAAELKIGCHAPEMLGVGGKIGGKIGGKKAAELKLGIHGRSVEQRIADGKKGGATTSAQRWQCLVTGHISTPSGLSRYQKKRGVDTSLRIKL